MTAWAKVIAPDHPRHGQIVRVLMWGDKLVLIQANTDNTLRRDDVEPCRKDGSAP